jgi:ferredoxin-fold anticodon binding domain-containing protein
MKKKIKNPNQKTKSAHIRMSEDEARMFVSKALKYTFGDVSKLIREAVATFGVKGK